MKFRSMWDPFDPNFSKEIIDDDIVTVPDQSLSVQQILQRFTRGTLNDEDIPSNGLVYDDSPDIDNVPEDYEDLVDVMESVKRGNDIIEFEREKQAYFAKIDSETKDKSNISEDSPLQNES